MLTMYFQLNQAKQSNTKYFKYPYARTHNAYKHDSEDKWICMRNGKTKGFGLWNGSKNIYKTSESITDKKPMTHNFISFHSFVAN